MNQKRGITLIALVITIIILLILAGVTISTLSGENGILTQTSKAKEETRGASVQELRDIWKTNKTMDSSINTATTETLDELLTKMKEQNLLTQEEVDFIKENEYIEIASRYIDFSEEITLEEDIGKEDLILVCSLEAGQKLILGVDYRYKYDCTIDFGDGTIEHFKESEGSLRNKDITHTYQNKGDYEIKITGTFEQLSLSNYPESEIKEVKQWGITGLKMIDIHGDRLIKIASPTKSSFIQLEGIYLRDSAIAEIPENLFANCPKITSFDSTFQNCSKLSKIPAKLFEKNVNVETFYATFAGCTSLTTIPEKLFWNCQNVRDIGGTHNYNGTFSNCTSLTEIPENLFKNNIKVENFKKTFSNCTKLTNIPENLFSNNIETISFDDTFSGCTSLIEIPEKLFSNNIKVTEFGDDWDFNGTFAGCTSLTTIPENLFKNNFKVTNFDGTFSGCTNLRNIPENLFANNLEVVSFINCFASCSNLQGKGIELWIRGTNTSTNEYKGNPDGKACYYNCTKLDNYNDIPEYWKSEPKYPIPR